MQFTLPLRGHEGGLYCNPEITLRTPAALIIVYRVGIDG